MNKTKALNMLGKIGGYLFSAAALVALWYFAGSGHRSYNPNYGDESEYAQDNSGCDVSDGNHSATVEYYYPKTGHQASYDLTVDVEDCKVIQINFNNGGWLDDSHIDPTELDGDGNAELEDDRGHQYTVHIDN